MTQMAFQEGRLPSELTWTTMILLLKGRGGYRGVGLVEVIWKMITTIINTRLGVAISLHDAMYGFW